MKPSWDDAPEWAQWLAIDFDGEWIWFECEPISNEYGFWDVSKVNAKSETAGFGIVKDWHLSLEPRP